MFRSLGAFQATYLTVTADTPITCPIPPRDRAYTRLKRCRYRTAGTAHALTFMKALGKTTTTQAQVATDTTLKLTADPGTGTPSGNIATNDWICVQCSDGTFFFAKVTNVSTLTITIAALPADVAAGATVWTFGAPGNHTSTQTNPKVNPTTGSTQTTVASSTQDFDGGESGLCQSLNQNEPMLVYSDNATAAGFMEVVSASYDMN